MERALIAGHDFVLLGERGQGKTRLLRALIGLLDEWTPVIAGAELGEHPYTPITPESIRRADELGDDLPVEWRHRSERYTEKLATPDTSVADLVGDIDPIKVAEGRSLGDPETIAYGLIPRAHRGIVAVNELPDLAERIQVSMLNVMEERDIQVRGYTLRLPLDVLVVASANPEDYTNRGRIITPLKDRFGAEIRTHYPLELEAEIGVIAQEAHLTAQVPDYLMQVIARFARYLRESNSVDQRSGVSARFAIAAAETVAAAARHRGAVLGETDPVARVVDLGTVIDVLRGKLEFESGEEGREQAVLEHLLRRATADTASRVLGGIDVGSLVSAVERGSAVTTGERVSAKDVLAAVPGLPVVDTIAEQAGRRIRGRTRRGAGAGARGAVPGQANRQGVRRGPNRLWLNLIREDTRHATRRTPAGPIRWLRRWICARRSSRSGRTSWPAPRRAAHCPSCCAAAPRTCPAPTGWRPRRTGADGICCAATT